MMFDTIYAQMLAAGVPTDSHESDLYVKATPEALAIVRRYRWRNLVTSFTHAVDGTRWLEIPFAFDPWWENRANRDAR